MKATAQIFLSYAREDREKVEILYQKLSEAGFKPWMDTKDILPGEKWKSSIQKAIRCSDFFLVCLSANSVDKRGWIQREIRDALDLWQEMLDSDIFLIPVRLDDCEAPESLRDFQWVNLFEENGWARLVKAIQVGIERRAEEESTPCGYDVFISYAREDSAWVRQYLYEPLLRCRTADGNRPRVFLDIGEEGIGIGQEWTDALIQAMLVSKKFVPVYSRNYFRKDMCQWELTMAFQHDPMGGAGFMDPILIDKQAESQVPMKVSHIQYRDVTFPNWLEQLCDALNLTPIAEQLALQFLDQPQDTVVNHTFPPLRVALLADGRLAEEEDEITISADQGILQGTTTLPVRGGIVIFDDLSMGTAVSNARLIATAGGCDTALSEPFSAIKPAAAPEPVPEPEREPVPCIPHEGEPVFFADSRAVAILMPDGLAAYDTAGQPLRSVPEKLQLRLPLRWTRRADMVVAAADWFGTIQAVWRDGHCATWSFGSKGNGWVVPGDMAIAGDDVYAGFWSGAVYRLDRLGERRLVFWNEAGVQALACIGDRFFVSGFDGKLCVYQGGRMVNTRMQEPSVRLLQVSGGRLVAVGEQNLYQIHPWPLQVLREELHLSDVSAVLGDVACPVVIDSEGKGIRFDDELTIRASFRTAAGAVPVSADDEGRCCVFRNPDGSHTLMMDGRIVFSTSSGALAVAPDGTLFAIGSASGIHIVTSELLTDFMQGERHGV